MSDERKRISDERRTHLTRNCDVDRASCEAIVDA